MLAEIEHLAFVSTVSQRAGGVVPRAYECRGVGREETHPCLNNSRKIRWSGPAEGQAEGFHRSRRSGARRGRTKRRASPTAAGMPPADYVKNVR